MAARKSRQKSEPKKERRHDSRSTALPDRLPPYSRRLGAPPEPLTEEQQRQVFDLLPLSDPASAGSVIAEIEQIRWFFHGLRIANRKRTREWRDARANELEKLAESSEDLASQLAKMSLDARIQAASVELIGEGRERTFSLRTEGGELPAIPRRDLFPVVYDGSRLLSEWAAEAAARLRAPMRKGRQAEFPPRALAGTLADIWLQYTAESLAPRQDRESETQPWPFLELVRAVGRTVDPEFDGYRAVRSVYELRRNLAQP